MSRGTPEADDFHGQIVDKNGKHYDLYIELLEGFSSDALDLDCRTREQGTSEWKWLCGIDLYKSQMNDTVSTDDKFNKALDKINIEIKKAFGENNSPIPESGEERIKWLIQHALKIENNEVTNGNE